MSSLPSLIASAAQRHPARLALVVPRGPAASVEEVTYGALWDRVARIAASLSAGGVREGDRVLVLVPPSADLYAAVLAAMALGAVAVLPPAGSGLRSLHQVGQTVRPRAVVSGARGRWAGRLVPTLWRASALCLDGPLPGGDFRLAQPSPDRSALFTFTSGTTGQPKGVDRTHGTLLAQHRMLDAAHPAPGDAAALTLFPVAALHHLCCGHTAALALPGTAAARPEALLASLRRHRVHTLTGPPPVLAALAAYVQSAGASGLSVRQVGVGGAPVARGLLEALRAAFPEADVQVLYGSSEAEPVAAIGADEVLRADPDGRLGYPAGHVHPDARVRLLPVDGADGWGEVLVAGPHVVERYVGAPEAEAATKVRDAEGRLWHRMGDVARQDADGRLWLGGRVGRLLPGTNGLVPPFPLEAQGESWPGVGRLALHAYRGGVIGWIAGTPAAPTLEAVHATVVAAGCPAPRLVPGSRLPVDARHRWKVDYAALDRMAARLSNPSSR